MSRVFPSFWVVIALSIFAPPAVWANVGPKWWGDLAADPQGLKGIHITREKLTIDLRPLASSQPADVEAIYYLDNPGEKKKLDLFFVIGAPESADFEVRLNGNSFYETVESSAGQLGQRTNKIPKLWGIYGPLPGFEEGKLTFFNPDSLRYVDVGRAFTVVLPSGPSILAAKYRARPVGGDENHPTTTWVFPYSLAPAKSWGRFGGLDLRVYIPSGWETLANLPLTQDDEGWTGTFTSLPANYLAVAVRAPVPAHFGQTVAFCRAGLFIGIALGAFLCWIVGRVVGRFLRRQTSPTKSKRLSRALLIFYVSVIMSIVWAGLNIGSCWLYDSRLVAALQGQESPYFNERHQIGTETFILAILALPAGFMLTMITTVVCSDPPKLKKSVPF
jgi:hypothetical protein